MSAHIRTALASLALGPALLLSSGCTLSIFGSLSDIEEETWVDASEKPPTLIARQYPTSCATGGSGSGTRIVAIGQDTAAFAHLNYTNAGELTSTAQVLRDAVSPSGNEPGLVARGDRRNFGGNNVGIGYTTGAQSRVALVNGDTGQYSGTDIILGSFPAPRDIDFGLATGADTMVDMVAVAGNSAFLVGNYRNTTTVTSCALGATGTANAVVVANFMGAAGSEDEIAVANDDGVTIFPASYVVGVAGMAAPPCFDGVLRPPLAQLAATGARTLAAGDFDGNGSIDLAVGRPGINQVDVWTNLGASAPGATITDSAGTNLGNALAAGDFDGDTMVDLVVADSGATAKGTRGAGLVRVYTGGNLATPAAELGDSDPSENQGFGRCVAVTPFNASDDILVVGAEQQVFTYFRLMPDDTDVRIRN